jgi:hypothetical protein
VTQVIGSQNNVPDIGDPITSPWHQDTARKIVHVFATTAARDAWISPPDGAVCQAPPGAWWNRVGGVWVRMSTLYDSGFNAVSAVAYTTVGVRDLLTFTIPPVAFPTLMMTHVAVSWGGDVSVVRNKVDHIRLVDGTITGPGAIATTAAGLWMAAPVIASWSVAANADPSYKVRITVDQFTGTAYVTAQSSWTRSRN